MKIFLEDKRLSWKGFTFIEVIISLFLLSFLILSTTQLILHSILIKNKSDNSLISAEIAASKLEYLKSLPFESEELKEASCTEIIEKGWAKKTFCTIININDVSLNMKEIEIESFAENCPEKKTRLILFISRHLGF